MARLGLISLPLTRMWIACLDESGVFMFPESGIFFVWGSIFFIGPGSNFDSIRPVAYYVETSDSVE